MNKPVDLAAERSLRREVWDGMTCDECGSAWFTVQAVAMNAEGSITSYMAPVTCQHCGHVAVDGAWATPSLEPVDPA